MSKNTLKVVVISAFQQKKKHNYSFMKRFENDIFLAIFNIIFNIIV
jgi:hypothetical protein